MKYHRHSYNPSGVPVDPSRNYMGSDGRWILLVPVSLVVAMLAIWAVVGTSVITPREGPQQVQLSEQLPVASYAVNR
jgi:hypothetical protein